MAKSKNSFANFSKLIALQEKQFPDVKKRFFLTETGKLVENIARKTPVDTETLKGGWRAQPVEYKGGKWILSCSNNVEYAEPVEYGHRWVWRKGVGFIRIQDFNPATDKAGVTKGRFMARDGTEETVKGSAERWSLHIAKWLEFFKKAKK